jgi:hypothetical protein
LIASQGTDPAESGIADTPKLVASILNTAASTPTSLPILALAAATGLGQSHPNAMRVGNRIYLAWRTAAAPADPNAEELWLKELIWTPATSTLDMTRPEIALPRASAHQAGDQRRPALAASPLAPEGALVTAWDDFGPVFDAAEGTGDVVLELVPTPVLRLPGLP